MYAGDEQLCRKRCEEILIVYFKVAGFIMQSFPQFVEQKVSFFLSSPVYCSVFLSTY
jgi:hypothetical protein